MFKQILFFIFAFVALIGMASALPAAHNDCETTPPPPCETAPLGATNDQTPCTHGDYTCLGDDSAVCNWGQWVVTTCGDGMKCLPYDWECVPVDQWDAWYEQVSAAQSSA